MNRNSAVAESYNLAIDDGFNTYLEEHATGEDCEIKIDEEKLVAEIEDKWLKTKLPKLDNLTPGEYIGSIASLDELVDFFVDIASVSDVGVPDILIDRLREYGKAAAGKLFGFVEAWLENKDDSKVLAVSQAVYAIGCLKFEEYKEKLIKLLLECFRDDLISEAIRAAIVEYDHKILEDLFKTFHSTDQAIVQEHLLLCVAEISRNYRSDEVFYFLKNAFRMVSNMKLAAEVLGDYGDGRAIPLLRGYVLKNMKELDKSTLNYIRAVIKKLGGEIDDLTPSES